MLRVPAPVAAPAVVVAMVAKLRGRSFIPPPTPIAGAAVVPLLLLPPTTTGETPAVPLLIAAFRLYQGEEEEVEGKGKEDDDDDDDEDEDGAEEEEAAEDEDRGASLVWMPALELMLLLAIDVKKVLLLEITLLSLPESP